MIEQNENRIKEGEKLYRLFWEENDKGDLTWRELGFADSTGKFCKDNELRALFLGVKPVAALANQELLANSEKINTFFSQIDFSKYGLNKVGNYIYNENLVREVIKKNPDVFSSDDDIEGLF
ncbi:hypothetical protein HC823_00150 [Candidatus Gracilibacteria bacterium]|nr:hypothetical protein [Candidatus Gracilibacteria bacterium]